MLNIPILNYVLLILVLVKTNISLFMLL